MHNRFVLPMVGMFLLAGCWPPSKDSKFESSANLLVLKSYAVPETYAEKLRDKLRGLLDSSVKDMAPIGRVQLGPNGKLLVLAPANVHSGLESVIAEISKGASTEPTPSIRFDYWVVTGKRAEQTSVASDLKNLTNALNAVTESDGPMHFELLEHLSVVGQSNQHSKIKGNRVNVDTSAELSGDTISARIYIEPLTSKSGSGLEVVPSFQTNQTLVLGRSNFESSDGKSGVLALYFVVKPTILKTR